MSGNPGRSRGEQGRTVTPSKRHTHGCSHRALWVHDQAGTKVRSGIATFTGDLPPVLYRLSGDDGKHMMAAVQANEDGLGGKLARWSFGLLGRDNAAQEPMPATAREQGGGRVRREEERRGALYDYIGQFRCVHAPART